MKRRVWQVQSGLALVLTLVACGGGGEEQESAPKKTVPATEVCGGLSPKAGQALERISETKQFEDRWYETADRLKRLLHDPDLDGGGEQTDCVILPDVADPDESPSKITVLYEEIETLPAPQPPGVALLNLPVGLRAEGGDATADLWFACEVPGVGKPIVHARLLYGPRPREGSAKEANIRVLQDLSRRHALAMGCPDAGGIPSV
ncbi:hypothetical protein ACIOJD_27870 [Streptomyces sp. NPDC088116]|uniref:hypothetical protein n=1 Tax=Streptomyces sp. NPDC088116 TaxID=3365825 RepID=UPI003808A8B9